MDVSCIVLAGGKSKRLGRSKVTETIGKQSLLERVISCLSAFRTEIIVVAAHDSVIPQLNHYPGVKLIEDIYPGKGTLGGIYSGLVAAKSFYSIVVACDMPFLNLVLLNYMVDQAADYDVVVPRTKDGILEPLHAVYSKHCLEPIEFLIRENRLSVLELYPMVKVRYIEDSDIGKIDPRYLSFFNINTEADLSTGREMAQEKDISNDKC